MPVTSNEGIRQKVDLHLKQCKDKINTCPEHQKFLKLQWKSRNLEINQT